MMGEYKLARHPRSGMHIIRKLKKQANKGLCGRRVGQSTFTALDHMPEPTIRKDPKCDEHNGWCPACFGLYANEFLLTDHTEGNG